MIQSRFGKSVFGSFAGLGLLGGLCLLWIVGSHQIGIEREATVQRLTAIANLLRHDLEGIDWETFGEDRLQELAVTRAEATSTYLTLVNANGRVVGDSRHNPRRMGNPLTEPEFREAVAHGRGMVQRSLEGTGTNYWLVTQEVREQGAVIGYVRVGSARLSLMSARPIAYGTIGGFVLLTIAVGFGCGRWMDRQVRVPLEHLSGACRQIAAGEHDVQPWPTARNEIGELSRTFFDMSESIRQRELALNDQNNRLETVLGSMVEGVIAVDAEQVVLLANDAVGKLLEIRVGRIVGRPLLEVTRNRSLDESFKAAMASAEPISAEVNVMGPSRRVLNLQANRLPGTPCPGAVMVLHDVTELRRLENLRRDFVANVSHELKTPLAAIRAYAETLQLGAVNDVENRDYFLRQITDQSDRLHELILDMLQIARIESGQEAFEIDDVDVSAVIEKCIDVQREPAMAKEVVLECRPSLAPVMIRADEEGLRTIVSNLVDNAIKYSPSGGLVTVSWRHDGPNVEITVEDCGIGIPPDSLERIFERFYRVDRARSREMGGTGLGLSIVKHLAQAFDGDVKVESEVGKGTRFRVYLPVAADPEN